MTRSDTTTPAIDAACCCGNACACTNCTCTCGSDRCSCNACGCDTRGGCAV